MTTSLPSRNPPEIVPLNMCWDLPRPFPLILFPPSLSFFRDIPPLPPSSSVRIPSPHLFPVVPLPSTLMPRQLSFLPLRSPLLPSLHLSHLSLCNFSALPLLRFISNLFHSFSSRIRNSSSCLSLVSFNNYILFIPCSSMFIDLSFVCFQFLCTPFDFGYVSSFVTFKCLLALFLGNVASLVSYVYHSYPYHRLSLSQQSCNYNQAKRTRLN